MSTQILVIEDEAQIRENIAEWLCLNGFTVETASDGKQGITQAVLARPDLIVCDIMMPNMDGYQVLQTLRANRSLASIPFLFLTAKTDMKDLRQGMALGADDYLTKPFTGESLLQAINSRLEREAQRKENLQAQLAEQHLQISIMATHEYNTPLNGIIGFSTLLVNNLSEFDGKETESMLESIRICGLRLKRSLDNVHHMDTLYHLHPSHTAYLFFTSGQTTIDPEIVKKQFEWVQKRQELKIDSKIEVATASLLISQENLSTILDELLDNAVKFSANLGLTVCGYCAPHGYQLIISNQGQEFKPENIAQIAPYTQFNRKNYEQQGFGLGLSIVKKLVELNKGSISIGSYADNWTRVKVCLPLAGDFS
ncbi:hybrid sensor histidine kinase/response regulator [Larkinella rosea]|uniref:histidine kinase n=1 Tax=Larkinella rosea TaxID=2025312 RepID=A0A3P1C1H0_9BACT|nr:response regulator [Larkinella rosea]RRB06913.1 hybrid sensor histidine kinase/response regulator [Larkinella rosea]